MAPKDKKQPTDEVMKARALSRWEGEGGASLEGREPGLPREITRRGKRKADPVTADDPVDTERAESGAKAEIVRAPPHKTK